eukprot:Opistho-2@87960
MGCRPSFPLKDDTICFYEPHLFSSTGSLLPVESAQSSLPATHKLKTHRVSCWEDADDGTGPPQKTVKYVNSYDAQQTRLWNRLQSERERVNTQRKNIEEMDFSKLRQKFPQWTEGELANLHMQFQMFDLNGDNTIDFDELNYMLDELNDETSHEERYKHFCSVDTDGSGCVEFEEFLQLVAQVQEGTADNSTGFGALYAMASERINRLQGRMTVNHQIQVGLF